MRAASRPTAAEASTRMTGRGPRTDQAYTFVKSLLLDGKYKPGDYLPIDELAVQLNSSRQPVMEAMRLLARDELVEVMPQVGCRVAIPTTAEIGDFYRLFSRTEGLAAELTAIRHEPNELKKLARLSAEIGDLKQATNLDERSHDYRVLNREFHGMIHEMARSPSIARLAGTLWDRGDFYVYAAGQHASVADFDEVQGEHESIIAAIAAHNGDRARAAMENHLLGFGRRVIAAVEARKD